MTDLELDGLDLGPLMSSWKSNLNVTVMFFIAANAMFFIAAIPCDSGTHVKYFAKGKKVYDEYYGLLIRISAQHVGAFKVIMMEKMV